MLDRTALGDKPTHNSPEMFRETTEPVPGGGRALDFFSQGLRRHVLVEREVGDEPFQATLFLLQLTEAPQFTHAEMGVLLFPGAEGGVTAPELPAEVADRGAASGLADRVHDLFFPASWVRSFREGPPKPPCYSSFNLPSFSGGTSRCL